MEKATSNRQAVTVREAGEMLAMSPHTMRAWIADRRIGIVRLGRTVRVPISEVERLLETGSVPARRDRQ